MDTNCPNCGAAAEPKVCSYCLTPNFRAMVDPPYHGPVHRVEVQYGWVPLRPEMVTTTMYGRTPIHV